MTAFRSLSSAMCKGFVRDRAALFFTFLFPLMFLVIFGLIYGNAQTSQTKIAVVGDGPIVQALAQTGAVDEQHFDTMDAALAKVRSGDLPAAVQQQGADVVLRFAQSDQVQAATVQGIVRSVVDHANAAQPPRVHLRADQVEDSSLKPIQYLTPGILSWAIATAAVFGASGTLVTWRKNRVLRRIRLAPVGPSTVLGSRLVVTIATALVQAVVFVAVAKLPVFGLQLSGQWWLGIPLLIIGTLAFSAIGLLVGAVARTQEAASAIAQIVVLPMAFLSGTFFPVDAAPKWLQNVSEIFPLRHMNDGMLNVLVRGKGIESLTVPALVLIGFTVVVGGLAAYLFQWEDDKV